MLEPQSTTLFVLLIVIFSTLLPSTFPTGFNFRTILSEKSVVALWPVSRKPGGNLVEFASFLFLLPISQPC